MGQIDAIFRNGVFEPLAPVDLKEEQHVALNIESADKEAVGAWLERVRRFTSRSSDDEGGNPFRQRRAGIAEDRLR